VAGGVAYTAYQLHYLVDSAASWRTRSDFIGAVARGEKPLSERQAVNILQWSLEVESRRTAAINESRGLLIELSVIAFLSCGVLALGIRSVPREHWPRFQFGRAPDA
jgi:hypothetical protein